MTEVSGKRSLGQRENQEDAYAILSQSEEDPTSDLLMLVSDGMGGHIGGEVASNLVITTFQEHFVSGSTAQNPRDRLLDSAHAANEAIKARIQTDPSLKGMGCTLVASLKMNDKLVWVSIGDSHVYLYRGGVLTHLNADHSVYGELMELVKDGKITPAEAKAHPRRNALRSAIIGTELALIDINSIDLQHGDLIVLATDGLDSLPNDKIAAHLSEAVRSDPKSITDMLLDAVEGVGRARQDNTTVVTYRHSETNRSTWSPDSKWGWQASVVPTLSSNMRNAIILVAGLCILAILIGLVAFRSTPDPDLSKATTKATTSVDPGSREETIGGGEGPASAQEGQATDESSNEGDDTQQGDQAPLPEGGNDADGAIPNDQDITPVDPDTSTDAGLEVPTNFEQ